MNEAKLYYTPPTDAIFEEVRSAAMALWATKGQEPSYSQEKIGKIKDIGNVQDNLMFMVAMFDQHNQMELASMLSDEARYAITARLIDGGMPPELIVF